MFLVSEMASQQLNPTRRKRVDRLSCRRITLLDGFNEHNTKCVTGARKMIVTQFYGIIKASDYYENPQKMELRTGHEHHNNNLPSNCFHESDQSQLQKLNCYFIFIAFSNEILHSE